MLTKILTKRKTKGIKFVIQSQLAMKMILEFFEMAASAKAALAACHLG